jgi:hypothetical protein
MIASKLPISRPQYWVHPRCCATDSFAVKGVLAVTVHTRQGLIAVFNTHLNAPCKVVVLCYVDVYHVIC